MKSLPETLINQIISKGIKEVSDTYKRNDTNQEYYFETFTIKNLPYYIYKSYESIIASMQSSCFSYRSLSKGAYTKNGLRTIYYGNRISFHCDKPAYKGKKATYIKLKIVRVLGEEENIRVFLK